MTAEALARIDADLARRVEAYLDSSVTAPTSRALITDLLAALIPEPPTDDEREALIEQATWALIEWDTDTSDRGVRDEHYRERRADVERIFPILARNRHRGPITDEIIQRACRAHYVEVWGDDLDPEYVFPPADVRAMRAALEAGSNGHRGSITRGGDARHVDALRDLAEHGLRFDLNPTMAITTADEVYAQWAAYARRMDESVRAHARAALAVAEAAQ